MAIGNKIIAFEDPEYGTMYIEVEQTSNDDYGDIAGDDDEPKHLQGKLSQVLSSLKNFGKGVLDTVKSLEPTEVEVKAGLKLTVSEGHLIGILAKASSEFPFEVTLKWKLDDQKQAEDT